MLDLDPGTPAWFTTCRLFRGVDVWTEAGWTPLEDDRPGSYYQPWNVTGYVLDGAFVPPSASAGCDLLMCTGLPSEDQPMDIGTTVEYVLVGTAPPPVDFAYEEPFERPEAVNVYESRPLHDVRVRSHVEYFTDPDCSEKHEALLEVAVP